MIDFMGHWWVLSLRGVAALILGALALFWPGATLLSLALVYGAFALIDGVLAAVAAFRANKGQRTPLVLTAIFGILSGVLALLWPGLTVLVLTLLVGVWAVMTGITEIVMAVRIRKEIEGEALIIVSGALSIIFGILAVLWPAAGALTLALLIGVYAIIAGITWIVLSLRLKKRQTEPRPTA
ncbi:DUF308 domain-containing protein [Nonomuraea sp. NPDC050404]|uniref:HdeD family acid-resistance protein n=1 Tax=Nonomuraea sp. NPDC050404 TaxID=3155783 RepID=UPI0033ED6B23